MVQDKWDISGSGSGCAQCSGRIEPETHFYSALVIEEGRVVRRDICLECWEKNEKTRGAFAFWRTCRIPKDAIKRRYAKIDIDLVWNIFSSMPSDPSEPAEEELRYVLALMLLRRRRLELMKSKDTLLNFRDKEKKRYQVKDPLMSEEGIAELTDRLGELLWERGFEGSKDIKTV